MTSLLSAISGQFSKNLILGTFIPVVTFAVLNLIFVMPLIPYEWHFFAQLRTFDTSGIVAIFFITIVATGLLYNLNFPIIRVYEGYPWKDSLIGTWRTRHYQRQLRRDSSLRARAELFRGQAKAAGLSTEKEPDDLSLDSERQKQVSRINSVRAMLGRSINTEFPISESSVLPTRLGNVIRSFEDYPQRQYNMAAITLWPRLIAKIDKEYATVIDDAKMSFDFMVNFSVLSMTTALAILFVGLIYPIPLASPQLLLPWLLEITFFALLSYVMYIWSIDRASIWGDMVKGAFDLYRWELLKQLGYKREPKNLTEERELWGKISRQMIYGYLYKEQLPEYSIPSLYAEGKPSVIFDIRRLLDTIGDDNQSVNIRIKNVDTQKRDTRQVIVTDTLPDGFQLVWGSALISSRDATMAEPGVNVNIWSTKPVSISGINPYRFSVGDLDYGQEIVLFYRVVDRKT